MKKAIKHLLSAVVFLLILAAAIAQLTAYFQKKGSDFVPKSFYKYEDGSFDVIFIGPSTIRHAVNPMLLWEDYGITSYNIASSSQTLAQSYYLAEEMFKHQHPKLLVVDAGRASMESAMDRATQMHYVMDTMPLTSKVRWKAVLDLRPMDLLQYLFPLDVYHTRWKEMTRQEEIPRQNRDQALGASLSATQRDVTAPERRPVDPTDTLPGTTQVYLEKLIELCEANGTELMFLTTPTIGLGEMVQATIDKRRSAGVALSKFLRSYGLIHLNDFLYGEDLGLDPATDSLDGHHLNALGAAKYTARLGAFFEENYELPDHREDPSYSWMNEKDEKYRPYYWKTLLTVVAKSETWLEYLEGASAETELMVLVAEGGLPSVPVSRKYARLFEKTGTGESLYSYGDYSYMAVIDRGEVVYESDVRSRSFTESWKGEAGGVWIEMESSASTEQPGAHIRIDGTDYAVSQNGLNVVVYDVKEHTVVDAVSVTLDGSYTLKHKG